MPGQSSHEIAAPRLPEGRPRRRLWVLAVAGLGGSIAVAGGLALAVRQPPDFSDRRPVEPGDDAAARRFLTKVAALRDLGRSSGSWDMALSEAECNAWLATDLPRNHPGLLPGLAEPRVRFTSGSVEMAAVVTEAGPLPGWLVRAIRPVASARIEVRLAAGGRLECRVGRCRLGMLPLPVGLVVHGLAGRLRRQGIPCTTPRVDGQAALVVTLPPGGPGRRQLRVAALSIDAGELLATGTMAER